MRSQKRGRRTFRRGRGVSLPALAFHPGIPGAPLPRTDWPRRKPRPASTPPLAGRGVSSASSRASSPIATDVSARWVARDPTDPRSSRRTTGEASDHARPTDASFWLQDRKIVSEHLVLEKGLLPIAVLCRQVHARSLLPLDIRLKDSGTIHGFSNEQRPMSEHSAIEWTDATWNPVRGCSKVSPGCKHCYAETFAERFRGVPGHPFEQGFDLRLGAGGAGPSSSLAAGRPRVRQQHVGSLSGGRARSNSFGAYSK